MSDNLDFSTLNIPIPGQINNYSLEIQKEIYYYLSNLNKNQQIAYIIAFQHLGSSFDIYRSNGFKEWKQQKK